jgi:hypothetical protein
VKTGGKKFAYGVVLIVVALAVYHMVSAHGVGANLMPQGMGTK